MLDFTKNSRGYSIVPRHLSGIQAGIQTAHSASTYAYYFEIQNDWYVQTDQTLILLESNNITEDFPLLEEYLKNLNIPFVIFKEPDLFNLPTSLYN